MKNLVFLGSRDISAKYLRYLIDQSHKLNYQIVAALTRKTQTDIIDLCKTKNIKVLNSLDDYLGIERVDIAVSIQYHLILRRPHLAKARQATLNLHMAPLPEYRGCNQFSFAIINEEKTFGTTFHLMEEGIDSGDIVCERRFHIPEGCWVKELYDPTEHHSSGMFQEFLPRLIAKEYTLMSQDLLRTERDMPSYKRKDVEAVKNIDLNWSQEQIKKHIRATSMPGYSPPYTIISTRKIEFIPELTKKIILPIKS